MTDFLTFSCIFLGNGTAARSAIFRARGTWHAGAGRWAREGNKLLADLGVRMQTWQELADALTPCAIVWGHDLKDCYHLAVLSGWTGELVWSWGVTGLRVGGSQVSG